jgi:hypothetical protein
MRGVKGHPFEFGFDLRLAPDVGLYLNRRFPKLSEEVNPLATGPLPTSFPSILSVAISTPILASGNQLAYGLVVIGPMDKAFGSSG